MDDDLPVKRVSWVGRDNRCEHHDGATWHARMGVSDKWEDFVDNGAKKGLVEGNIRGSENIRLDRDSERHKCLSALKRGREQDMCVTACTKKE